MNTAAISTQTRAVDLPIERLAASSDISQDDKVGELSKQFETLLLREILKNAQKTVFKSRYHQDSFAGGVYQDMVTQQLADSVAKSGTFGMASTLNRQLLRQQSSNDTSS